MSDAGLPRDDDFQGSFFAVEVQGETLAWFTGCTGISLEFEPITFNEGNGKSVIQRKRPGRPKYSEIVLKRGFTKDTTLYDWFQDVVEAKDKTPYKTGSIVIYDRLQKEGVRFNLTNMWPSKCSVSDVKAGDNSVMIEEITIQHELIEWAK
jgi:phage tail-like protein